MNVGAIQQVIRAEGLDGWLFFDHHRRDPLAYRILSLPPDLQPTRRWYYFIPATGAPRALTHKVEQHALHSLPGDRFSYARWGEHVEGVRGIVGDAKRIAMQYSAECSIPYVSMVDAGTIELIRGVGVDVVSSANLVQYFEARWSDGQLESHLAAGRLMDRIRAEAFSFAASELSAGVTEWDVHTFLRGRFEDEGLQTDHGPIVAVNSNASDPHYEPTVERHSSIRAGDLLLIDMWAKLRQPEAVYYDITWTGFCGAAIPPKLQAVFKVVTEARDGAVDFVEKSVSSGRQISGFEVDDVARGIIEKAGYGPYFVHRTGHSIGTEVHGAGANMDNFETHDVRRLIPQTCFSIEPGVYLPEFGIRSEVNMFVGESNSTVTGEIQRELVRVV